MLNQLRVEFLQWTGQVKHLVANKADNLQPQEYCIGAVFVIAIGFVLLSGRR
ncbi:MAG: hypothetical protein ABGZ24_07230 [Fuerstiella sp.]